jgi:hypothetical protein
LKFTSKESFKGREFNRKTKNIWNRNLQESLCNKYCDELGIIFEYVEARYSSFIGNMLYSYSDCVSSSIEIGRRSYSKYQSGLIRNYPSISSEAKGKVSYLLGISVDKLKNEWISLQKQVKQKYETYEGSWRNANCAKGGKELNGSMKSAILYHLI